MLKQDNDPSCGLTAIFKTRRIKLFGFLVLLAATVICITLNQIKFFRFPKQYLPEQADSPNETDHSKIVFLETSGRVNLKARDGCALESAARHNPQRTVVLFSISQIYPEDAVSVTLRTIPNVKFGFLDATALFTNTPLYGWYTSGQLKESSYPIQHLSDAARLAILWKYGGMYLDTDMISIRPLGNISNTLGYGGGNAGNSALTFERGHPFLWKCMEEYARNYSKTAYDFHGPKLVTRVLKMVCFAEDLSEVINSPESCQGITLLPHHTFFAFPWTEWKKLFENAQKTNMSDSYTVHMYAKMSTETTGKPGDGSLLDTLSMNNCPTIYQLMVKQNIL